MNPTLPLITIFGATGAQGGGLARAILARDKPDYQVRAVTRKPESDAARGVAALGAEIVVADLDDPASVQRAMHGAHGVYAVTNFWEHFSPDKELKQAETLAEAARREHVAHVIWSTLEDTRRSLPADGARMPVLMGNYNVPHFDAKGEANRFFSDRALPVTFLYTSFYWDNLIHFGMGPQRGDDGGLIFVLPIGDKALPGIAAADIGACAAGVFRSGPSMIGRSVGIAGEHLTGAEMASALARALGEPVSHVAMPPAQYAKLGFPGADDLANMFQFNHDFAEPFCAARPVAESHALHPNLLNFEAWLLSAGASIPVPPKP
ncbi:MAG: NmrA/HSCARG family protein [Pseudomonadota bacterium]|nr:NmrA/HSCARG family protein [Pseudomonadota bacterium]